jgi:hypothetical protein
VVDQRKGVERRYLPPAGVPNSELTTFAGQILERDLATDLGWQGSYAVESLCSRLQGGGSSVSMNLSQKTSSGGNRFYVPSHMGFFPGTETQDQSARRSLHCRRARRRRDGQVFRHEGNREGGHPSIRARVQQAQRRRARGERYIEFRQSGRVDHGQPPRLRRRRYLHDGRHPRISELTDASEFYKKDELTPLGKASDNVYRWWYITEVKDAGAVAGVSRAYFFVDRPNQRSSDVATSGPLLFREINVTESKAQVDTRTLRYIIAPGAWVSDVRNGVAGNVLGNEGAQPSDARKIVLAPGHPDLVADDPITNPPGADVLQPSGFRVRHVHQYPAFGPGASFVSENLGRVQVGNGLFIGGTVIRDPGETMPDAIKRVQKDQRPLYINGALIAAPTDTAIRVEAYTERAAVELFQLDCDQDIVWWSSDYSNRSSLHRDRTSGDFVFTSYKSGAFAAPNLTGPGGISLTRLSGISSTSTAALNVCGFQTVVATKLDASVQFPKEPEPDRRYHVFIQCNWHTQSAVVMRSETASA